MDQLEAARRQIDAVDAQLADLFEQRMAAVLQVAEYKKAHGLPILTPPGRRPCWTKPPHASTAMRCAPTTGTMCSI